MAREIAVADLLRERIQAGLHLGTLHPGDRLASLREVGAEVHAGPRVVMAAYQRLAAEGLVRLRRRSGVFVEAPSVSADPSLPDVASWMVEVFLRGLSRGIAPTHLRRQARACLEGPRVAAACLECNDDQLRALCGQLRDDYGFAATGVDLDALAAGEPLPPKVAEAELLLTTRFHAADAQRLGRRLRRPVVVATLDAAFYGEIRRMLARGPVWWICTDPRFAAKLPRMWPGASINPVVLDRDPLGDVPPEAMVYATRAAAERLPPSWHGGRFVTTPRAFSDETARALLGFRLRRNLEAIAHS